MAGSGLETGSSTRANSACNRSPNPEGINTKVITTACFGTSCCKHPACEPLKQAALCREWYCLRWVSSVGALPSKMLCVLRERLANRAFRYCAALTDEGVYEVLLRLDESGFTGLLVPGYNTAWFDASKCKAWPFECCWDALVIDTELWVRKLADDTGRFVFGDKTLPYDLAKQAKSLGAQGGEI